MPVDTDVVEKDPIVLGNGESIYESLTVRARLTFLAHLFKACFKQHHKSLTAGFATFLQPDSVVLDIGAHSGQYTKLVARIVPEGHVWAAEPSSYAYKILQRAIRLNGLQNVTTVRTAFSDYVGDTILHMPIKKSGSMGFGLSHFGDQWREGRYSSESVPVTTVDQFVAERKIPHVDLIKADIEGWEVRVLAGAKDTIQKFKPAIYLELVDNFLLKAGDSISCAWERLEAAGYSGFRMGDDGTLAPAESRSEGDLLFLAKNR